MRWRRSRLTLSEALAERVRLPAGAVVLNKPYRKAELARRVREALAPAE